MPEKKKPIEIIPCGVAVIERDREFLIAQRMAADTYGNYWEFPGGRKNAEESFAACVAREVAEEIGVKIEVKKKLTEIKKRFSDKIIWLNFFLCSYASGEPKPIECQAVRWAGLEELTEIKFPPANHVVIKKLTELYGR